MPTHIGPSPRLYLVGLILAASFVAGGSLVYIGNTFVSGRPIPLAIVTVACAIMAFGLAQLFFLALRGAYRQGHIDARNICRQEIEQAQLLSDRTRVELIQARIMQITRENPWQ